MLKMRPGRRRLFIVGDRPRHKEMLSGRIDARQTPVGAALAEQGAEPERNHRRSRVTPGSIHAPLEFAKVALRPPDCPTLPSSIQNARSATAIGGRRRLVFGSLACVLATCGFFSTRKVEEMQRQRPDNQKRTPDRKSSCEGLATGVRRWLH
jgi:hypothetical protein